MNDAPRTPPRAARRTHPDAHLHDPPQRDVDVASAGRVGARTVVVGAGPIGRSVAALLTGDHHHVDLVSRSGRGVALPGVTVHALDATDATALGDLARGTAAIINCASPAYHRWPEGWPALSDALIRAAERAEAPLVNLSNLYAYGPTDGPMRPEQSLAPTSSKAAARARSWESMLAAHASGRIRAAEVRASDFIGPGTQSHLGDRVVPNVLAGKACQVIGDPDAAHAWCFRDDVARTLCAVARRSDAHGRVWHAPVTSTRSQREAIDDLADAAGVPKVAVSRVPKLGLWLVGLFDRDVRELRHVRYQFERPFLVDDDAARRELGIDPTPWSDVLRSTIEAYRRTETGSSS